MKIIIHDIASQSNAGDNAARKNDPTYQAFLLLVRAPPKSGAVQHAFCGHLSIA